MTALSPRSAAASPALRASARTRTRRRTSEPWRLAAIAVIWLTSLFVVALWVAGGGVSAVASGGGAALTTLGRATGLVAANLLLYQVLLMARIPLFERGFGRDGMVRMHRQVGFWSFWLMLAHIVLLVLGYAASAGVNPLVQLWDFVWDYPGMLLATAGTGLLVLVVVTSLRRARRRMRYESWHLLHLYAYLGVGLAIPHMLWTGADFLASPAATAYWWTLWGVAAASVLVFRLALPLLRSWRHGVRVTAVQLDGRSGLTVRMRGRRLRRVGARPGQFFVWRFLGAPGWTRGMPLSLSAAPRGDEWEVTARVVGDGTRRLATLPRGARVLFEGPYGHMTGDARQGTKLLLLGAGAGVAPLVALLQGEDYAPGDATIITRDHDAADALRRAELAELVTGRGVVHIALDGPRALSGSTWLPASHGAWPGPQLLRHVAPDLDAYDVFLCGPAPWMEALRRDLRAAGVPAGRIHSESFAI